MTDTPTLTPKQELFCQEYLVDLNGAAAARRAGYSEHTAQQIAAENLTKPLIADKIAALKKERSERTAVTADRVLARYAELAFADGPVSFAADFEGMELKTDHVLKALNDCGRHLGMFTDKVEHGGEVRQNIMQVPMPVNSEEEFEDQVPE